MSFYFCKHLCDIFVTLTNISPSFVFALTQQGMLYHFTVGPWTHNPPSVGSSPTPIRGFEYHSKRQHTQECANHPHLQIPGFDARPDITTPGLELIARHDNLLCNYTKRTQLLISFISAQVVARGKQVCFTNVCTCLL